MRYDFIKVNDTTIKYQSFQSSDFSCLIVITFRQSSISQITSHKLKLSSARADINLLTLIVFVISSTYINKKVLGLCYFHRCLG